MRDDGIFVANSYTGVLYPVDRHTIRGVLSRNRFKEQEKFPGLWSKRCQTILDLMLAGF